MRELTNSPERKVAVGFRPATQEDISTVQSLLNHLGYNPPYQKLRDVFLELLTNPSFHCILAVSRTDGHVLGMITLRSLPCLRLAGELVSIEELVVHAGWRGRGIGQALTAYALEYAKNRHAVRIEVLTSEARESTQRGFYEKAGFVQAPSRVYRIDLNDDDALPTRCAEHVQPCVSGEVP